MTMCFRNYIIQLFYFCHFIADYLLFLKNKIIFINMYLIFKGIILNRRIRHNLNNKIMEFVVALLTLK